MIYANQRKYDEAIALLSEAAALNPLSFAVHRDLGATYLAAGKIEDAIAAWKKASAINPTNAGVHPFIVPHCRSGSVPRSKIFRYAS